MTKSFPYLQNSFNIIISFPDVAKSRDLIKNYAKDHPNAIQVTPTIIQVKKKPKVKRGKKRMSPAGTKKLSPKRSKDNKVKKHEIEPLPFSTKQSPCHSISNTTGHHSTVVNISNSSIADGAPKVPPSNETRDPSTSKQLVFQEIIEQAKRQLEEDYRKKKRHGGCGEDELEEYDPTEEPDYDDKLDVWVERFTMMHHNY
jgi:hypothetical protein